MKKKQFKRLEKLLVDTLDAHVHSNTLIHSLKSDQRAIADTHSEGGSQILAHLGQIVSLLETDDYQDALNTIGDHAAEALTLLGTIANNQLTLAENQKSTVQATTHTTKSIEALSKNLDFWLAKNKGELEKLIQQGSDRPTFKQSKEQLQLLDRVGDRLVDLHTCLDAWGKFFKEDGGVTANLVDRSEGRLLDIRALLNSIDTQMAPVSHASAQWSRSQVRSGPGLDEFTAGGTDIPEPKAPEGPDPTTADSWAGKMGDDLVGPNPNLQREDLTAKDLVQREAVARFEAGLNPVLTNAEDVARQGDSNPRGVVDRKMYDELMEDHDGTLRALQRSRAQFDSEHRAHNGTKDRLTSALEDLGTAIQERQALKEELAAANRQLDAIGKRLMNNPADTNALSYIDIISRINGLLASKEELAETQERLKVAFEDLGGHTEGLPVDASMDHFIKWVGNHGWKWIMGHRATINERLDRMEREAAYNRGNAIVQDVTTTEDRGVITSTLGKPRPIKDNPQA